MAKEKRKKGKLTGILRMPKGSDKILHFTVLVLVLFGSVMIVDINVGQTSSNNMVVITTAVKQGLFMIAGYVAMLFAAKVFEFNWFYRLSKVIIIAMTVCSSCRSFRSNKADPTPGSISRSVRRSSRCSLLSSSSRS